MRFIIFSFGLLFLSVTTYGAECAKLKAYGNPEYPPYLWRASSGTAMRGATVDYLQEISKEIKVPIEAVYGGTWARVQEEARYGRVDLVLGAFYNRARETYLEYLRPSLTQTRTVIWVRSDDKIKYREWSDLKDLQGVTVINNSFGQKFDEYAKNHLKVSFVASLQQAFDMLKNKRVRYLIYEEWPAKSFVSRYSISGVRYVEPIVAEELLYLAMAKKSSCATPALKEKINAALEKMAKQNLMPGMLKDSSQRWNLEPR